jgi:site-specific recombinase XerC
VYKSNARYFFHMTAIVTLPSVALVVPAVDHSPAAVYLASLAPSSQARMRRALDACTDILGAGDAESCPWAALRVEHVAALRARLGERFAPATANLHLAALRGVLKACRRLGLISRDQEADLSEIEPVRGERVQAGRYIELSERQALFEACTPDAAGLRDRAALAILFGAGLRREEAVTLELSSYDPKTGDILVTHAKGGKQRRVEGSANGRIAINEWLAVRGTEPGALLCVVGKGGRVTVRRMTTQALHERVKLLGRRAGVVLACHDARRTLISDLLDRSDMATVASLAGHANTSTTAKYCRRGERARRRAMLTVALPIEPRVTG